MGAEVAHLERHGHQDRWRSNLCWIAGCDRAQVGSLSPHLLDRFALRLQGEEVKQLDRTDALRAWLETVEQQPEIKSPPLPTELSDRLLQVRQHRPAITDAASRRVLDYLAISEGHSLRRDLALLRLAQTQAQLAGVAQVDVLQVDEAAQMIGLKCGMSITNSYGNAIVRAFRPRIWCSKTIGWRNEPLRMAKASGRLR